MKKIKSILFCCFLSFPSLFVQATELVEKIILPTDSKLTFADLISATQPICVDCYIEVDPSLPGFNDDPFCQEKDKNPNIIYCRRASPEREKQYIECLLDLFSKGDKRTPHEIMTLLKQKEGQLKAQLSMGIEKLPESGYEPLLSIIKGLEESFDRNFTSWNVSLPTNFLEGFQENFRLIKDIGSWDIEQRVNFLIKISITPVTTLYVENPEEFIVGLNQIINEQNKLAEELLEISATRGYCHAQHAFALGLLEEKNDLFKAKELLRLAVDQDFGFSQFRLGLILEQEGDLVAAGDLYVRGAINRNRDALLRVGLMLESKDNQEDAKRFYAALYKECGNTLALFHFGRILEAEGNLDEAEKVYSYVFLEGILPATLKLKEMKQADKLTYSKEWFTLSSDDNGDDEYMLGLKSADQCQFAMADDYLKKAAEKGHPAAMVLRAKHLAHLGDPQEVSTLLVQAHIKGYVPSLWVNLNPLLIGMFEKSQDKEEQSFYKSFREEKSYPNWLTISEIIDKSLS